MDLAPELYVGYVVGVTFLGLFILASFIADVLDKKREYEAKKQKQEDMKHDWKHDESLIL